MNDRVIEFLVENLDEEFEGAELVGTWEGYDVYSPVYSRVSTKGIPFFALAERTGSACPKPANTRTSCARYTSRNADRRTRTIQDSLTSAFLPKIPSGAPWNARP